MASVTFSIKYLQSHDRKSGSGKEKLITTPENKSNEQHIPRILEESSM